jgi:hypothetical protein
MKLAHAFILSLCSAATAAAQTNALNASGSVGIGTTSPNMPLTVVGPNEIVDLQSTAASSLLYFSPSGGWHRWRVGAGDINVNDFGIRDITAGATRLSITGTGEVGVGTSTPRSKLQVLGPITAGFAGGSTSGIDYLYGLYGSGALFVLGSQYSSAASFLGYAVKAKPGAVGYLSSTEIPAGRSAIEASMGYIAFLTGQTQTSTDGGPVDISEHMRIGATGNVGIGTINPTAKLTIVGGAADPLQLKDSTGHSFRVGPSVGTSGGFQFYDDVAGAIRIRIADSGNVGIGETNPTHKLAVNGTIKAKEVIVETTGWSDYVFADGYALQPLADVEAHIKTNKHLPGIPSAAQIGEQGVSLGDMQAKLLAKIEELTLHQIAQEKLLKAQTGELKAQLATQAEELNILRAEVRTSRK